VRLHLDDCDESNGPLRVLGGSHKFGRIPDEQVRGLASECPETLCRVGAGGALLIRPLLLHASSRSTGYGHRRVLHIEYAGGDLPAPLRWHEQA
jgi:ectoine hydroxylase-related dioxygenase (phytanoyl-CoA dioxygenase family)